MSLTLPTPAEVLDMIALECKVREIVASCRTVGSERIAFYVVGKWMEESRVRQRIIRTTLPLEHKSAVFASLFHNYTYIGENREEARELAYQIENGEYAQEECIDEAERALDSAQARVDCKNLQNVLNDEDYAKLMRIVYTACFTPHPAPAVVPVSPQMGNPVAPP